MPPTWFFNRIYTCLHRFVKYVNMVLWFTAGPSMYLTCTYTVAYSKQHSIWLSTMFRMIKEVVHEIMHMPYLASAWCSLTCNDHTMYYRILLWSKYYWLDIVNKTIMYKMRQLVTWGELFMSSYCRHLDKFMISIHGEMYAGCEWLTTMWPVWIVTSSKTKSMKWGAILYCFQGVYRLSMSYQTINVWMCSLWWFSVWVFL